MINYSNDFATNKLVSTRPCLKGCVDIRPTSAKRPTIKMTILTDSFQKNVYKNFKMPMNMRRRPTIMKRPTQIILIRINQLSDKILSRLAR
jgi:hypothetical protein